MPTFTRRRCITPCSARPDFDGKNFYYDNPLVADKAALSLARLPLLRRQHPAHAADDSHVDLRKGDAGLYVNLFIGSTINVERVAGTDVQMVQKTDYPWSGNVSITVNPKQPKKFTVFVRVPDRTTSELYTPTPAVSGLKSLSVNGKTVSPRSKTATPPSRANGKRATKLNWNCRWKFRSSRPMNTSPPIRAASRCAMAR